MTSRLGVACFLAVVTLIGFFVFPGHTYLQSDTQIYVPMMERIADPSAFPRDLVATKPHLSYTIYDDVAIAVHRWIPFETSLTAEQIVYRALQLYGIYLLATALPLSPLAAFAVMAVAGLGATIVGPAVLLLEYEPVPRGYAIGLIFLAIGLTLHSRPILGSVAASLAFLYHAPTTFPFWACFLPVVVWRRQWKALIPLGAAIAIIMLAAHFQAGVIEQQHFFFRIDPDFEKLQRMRASYNWVSVWAAALMKQYIFYWLASLLAYWRLKPKWDRTPGLAFALGLPIIGILSVPLSFLLLERLKWGLIPQYQPARALLFVTAFAMILGAAAAVRAAEQKNRLEAALWFTLVLAIPMKGKILDLEFRQWLLAGALALACTLVPRKLWLIPLTAAYFLIPTVGRIENYPLLETSQLTQLEEFARTHTAPDAMFAFPDAGRALYPGVFRVRAKRPVYVDWKSGGQVNYYRSLADDWWSRWRQFQDRTPDLQQMSSAGIEYVVMRSGDQLKGQQPIFQNDSFLVYRVNPVAR
jgi:hypothetical protein